MMKKLINPFRYLPLRQAICWGIAALILVSVYCWQMGFCLTSITQISYAGGSLATSTARQVVAWLLFAVVLYVGGVVFSRSAVRFWDVASFNLFARIPFHLTLLIFAIPTVRSIMGMASDGNLAAAMEHANMLSIVGLVSLLISVWYFYWSYKAFAEATNLKNGRGVAIFILCFVVTYIASGLLLPYVTL